MTKHCCDRMAFDLAQTCSIHKDRFECVDCLVDEMDGRYGLIVHDGGRSVIQINYCPWCGTRLPKDSDLISEPLDVSA